MSGPAYTYVLYVCAASPERARNLTRRAKESEACAGGGIAAASLSPEIWIVCICCDCHLLVWLSLLLHKFDLCTVTLTGRNDDSTFVSDVRYVVTA